MTFWLENFDLEFSIYFFSPVQDQALVHPLSTQAWYLKPEIFEIIFEKKKLKKKTRKFFRGLFYIFFSKFFKVTKTNLV